MIRKTALLGSITGHWVRTSGMDGLRLSARVREGTHLKVESYNEDGNPPVARAFVGPGIHEIGNAVWSRVSIIDGVAEGAICLFEAR